MKLYICSLSDFRLGNQKMTYMFVKFACIADIHLTQLSQRP
jgi:hypothetical protein